MYVSSTFWNAVLRIMAMMFPFIVYFMEYYITCNVYHDVEQTIQVGIGVFNSNDPCINKDLNLFYLKNVSIYSNCIVIVL